MRRKGEARRQEMGNSSSFFAQSLPEPNIFEYVRGIFIVFPSLLFYSFIFPAQNFFCFSPGEKGPCEMGKGRRPCFRLFLPIRLPSEMDSRVWFRLLNVLELAISITPLKSQHKVTHIAFGGVSGSVGNENVSTFVFIQGTSNLVFWEERRSRI